ncbi:MAG: SpoIID/LytB domain-containing protein [Acidobacteriota bacterium]
MLRRCLALTPLLAAMPMTSGPSPTPTVLVWRCSQQHPVRLEIESPERHVITVNRGVLQLDGGASVAPLRFESATWRVVGRGGFEQRDHSALSVQAHDGELRLIAELPLEEWVARAVAAESLIDTPTEALRAQAIVSRSFALAKGRRHPIAQLCDLAHCASLTSPSSAALRVAALNAAEATRGLVLRDANGSVLRAVFHRCCGGGTADPRLVFGGDDDTGAAPCEEPECANERWQATVPRLRVEQAAAKAFGVSTRPAWQHLQLQYRPDGRVARVVNGASGRFATGDQFARALDAALGWGTVRSTRFSWRKDGEQIVMSGAGSGHGVGLCQLGAARWATRGDDAEQILRRYFPHSNLASLTPLSLSAASSLGTTRPGERR